MGWFLDNSVDVEAPREEVKPIAENYSVDVGARGVEVFEPNIEDSSQTASSHETREAMDLRASGPPRRRLGGGHGAGPGSYSGKCLENVLYSLNYVVRLVLD